MPAEGFRTSYTREVGGSGLPSTGRIAADGSWEQTPELAFPESVRIYDRMRREDAQVGAVLRAITLPIRRARWSLDGDDVRPELIAALTAELRLGEDERRGRRRREQQGVSWREHLRLALLMLPLGFIPFEQVYRVGPPLTGQQGLPSEVAHLRKLAPRMPRTIVRVEVARDGGLDGIVQLTPTGTGRWDEVTIPVDRLLVYVNDREGADWHGLSILRQAYKHWMVKDVLLRLGPIVVERNGMGIPVVEAPPGGSEAKALDLATRVRVGEEAGAGLPAGYKLSLVGVSGSIKDELPLVKYHDQAIGRNALAMFLDLGHDRGARSLGETFADFFALSLDAVAEEVAETATDHLVGDWVELNLGAEEPYPVLGADPITGDQEFTAEAIAGLADSGLLTPDRELEGEVRRRYGLPALPPVPGTPGAPVPGSAGAEDIGLELTERLARATERLAELRS